MPTRPNLLNHRLADGVRKMGFRKWYERELLSSHAHMVLTLLSTIGMLASFEAFRGASMAEKLMDTLFVIVCAAIALWSLRRYLFLLMRAELVANQANCPACAEYGRFDVVAEAREETRVCCRKCTQQWVISSDS